MKHYALLYSNDEGFEGFCYLRDIDGEELLQITKDFDAITNIKNSLEKDFPDVKYKVITLNTEEFNWENLREFLKYVSLKYNFNREYPRWIKRDFEEFLDSNKPVPQDIKESIDKLQYLGYSVYKA